MIKTVLLAGFTPFGGESVNPGWEAVAALDGRVGNGYTIASRKLPCAFGASLVALTDAIEQLSPSLVIVVGQAGGRSDISIERVAINVDDAPIADSLGALPIDQVIAADGPVGYFSSLPLKVIVHSLRESGIPASVSSTAGTFVCNHVFYGLMHFLSTRNGRYKARAGFIHIPYLPSQVAARPGAASMALDIVVCALRCAIEAVLTVEHDRVEIGGSTH